MNFEKSRNELNCVWPDPMVDLIPLGIEPFPVVIPQATVQHGGEGHHRFRADAVPATSTALTGRGWEKGGRNRFCESRLGFMPFFDNSPHPPTHHHCALAR